MDLILAVLLIFFIILFGLIPFFLIYPVCNLAGFVMHRIMGYRKQVIKDNLTHCFPEKNKQEMHELIRRVYLNLTDIIIEGIKSFTMGKRQILKRHKIINPEVLAPYIENGQSIIGVTAHYNNWEWGSLSGSLQVDLNVVAFYKPLSNPFIDRFLQWSRSRFGTTLASIHKTTHTFDKHAGETCIFLMAADQNPGNPDKAIWVDFLGRETAFLHGPRKTCPSK